MDLAAEIMEHRRRAEAAGDYEAVDHLWTAFIKAASPFPGRDERARVQRLIESFDPESLTPVLQSPGFEQLAALEPPLDSILYPGERSRSQDIAKALCAVRDLRNVDPQQAMQQLVFVLKVIRDKRVHGFKSVVGPRDQEILGATRYVLDSVSAIARDHLGR